jgi:plastocyanin
MRAALLAAAAALAVAGCGDGDEPAVTTAKTAPPSGAKEGAGEGAPVVDMNDQLAFVPRSITVSVGDKVTWRNVGSVAHTVTTDPKKASDPKIASVPAGVKPWDSGFINGGQSYSYTFRKPGTYRYFCIPHENAGMVGTVVVQG